MPFFPQTDLIYGLIGVSLFLFRNPDKKFLIPIAVFTLGLFISQLFFFGDLISQVIWIIATIGLIICYSLRFISKVNRRFIDILKIPALVLLIIYPSAFYSLVHTGEGIVWYVLHSLSLTIISVVYVYDRWILKPETMKKKYIIILTLQTCMILLMLVYALVQKAAVEQQRIAAEDAKFRSIQMQKQCEEARALLEEKLKKNSRNGR